MKIKAHLTLKAKILFGIIVLIGITICFNLIYSHNLFVEDKKSYIFESTLKRAEGLADELVFKINAIRQSTLLISRSLDKSNDEILEVFKENQDLLNVVVIEHSALGFEIIRQVDFAESIKQMGGESTEVLDIKKILLELGSISPVQKLTHFVDYQKRSYFIITEPIKSTGQILVTLFNGENILRPLKNDRLFLNSIYWKMPGQKMKVYGPGNFQSLIGDLKSSKIQKGVQERAFAGHDYLVAYITNSANSFTLISAVDSTHLYSATRALVLKTLLFALVLLGAVIIAGILFSVSLTNPIRKLTQAAYEIAKGNFDFKAVVETNDEIKILSNAFGTMSSEIKELLNAKEQMIVQLADANAKLEDYSHNLERMVEQRTAELKTANDFMGAMVNSLDQGLVVFDQDLKCNDIYTKAAERIFEHIPQNSFYTDLLGVDSEREKDTLKQWANITFSGMLPFESAVGLAPNKREWGEGVHDQHFKMVSIDYFPMKDVDGKLLNIVAVGTDKTKEVLAIESFKEEEKYVAMILKILNNKMQFESFLSEVHSIFDQFKLAYIEEENKINLELCMILFHTLNGGFGLYSLYHLQLMAQKYEQEISDAKYAESISSDFAVLLNQNVRNLTIAFNKQLEELDSVLGTTFLKGEKNREVSKEKIDELKKLVDSLGNAELKHAFYEGLVKVPIIHFFKAYNDLVQLTAAKLSKEIAPIIFHHSDVRIDSTPYEEFFSTMVHLFRNCADHGIEEPQTRLSLGKERVGHIEVSFLQDKNHLIIDVKDDGAGIDPKRIREKCKELDPSKDYDLISDEEIKYRIFDPFFSTREAVTSISGRGVGMSAIKETVDRLGGKIEIFSEINKGGQFRFILPLF